MTRILDFLLRLVSVFLAAVIALTGMVLALLFYVLMIAVAFTPLWIVVAGIILLWKLLA